MSGDHPGPDAPLLFVTVGTDHHPFPRLFEWIGRWHARHPGWRIEIQHGATPKPRLGSAVAYRSPEEMTRLMEAAAVVVTHAGPATITQARKLGHVPVVVPRDPRWREHVDDHQLLFTRRLAASGLVWLADSEARLGRAIPAALAAAARQADGAEPRVPPGVTRVAEVVEELVDIRRASSGRGVRSPGRRPSRSRLRH